MSQSQFIQFQIQNNTGISDDTLYLYVTGPDCYGQLDSSTDCISKVEFNCPSPPCPVPAIQFNSLPQVNPDSDVRYLYFDQQQSLPSCRIWFSDKPDLLSIILGKQGKRTIQQPPVDENTFVFDFIEVTFNDSTGTTQGNINIDTTQVDGMRIPITIVNLATAPNLFPVPSTNIPTYTYPNAIGIQPALPLSLICESFNQYVKILGSDWEDTFRCVQNYDEPILPDSAQYMLAPGHLYDSPNTVNSSQFSFFDAVINQFFTYYDENGNNTLSISYKTKTYTGRVQRPGKNQPYYIFNFEEGEKIYPIYYPYFSQNTDPSQKTLYGNNTLPPPPPWLSSLNSLNFCASAQVLSCNGVFNDGNSSTSDPSILATLQNIVVAILNRGLIPSEDNTSNNLFVLTGTLALTPSTYTDENPNAEQSMSGASLIYIPTVIPSGTSTQGAFVINATVQWTDTNLGTTTQTITYTNGQQVISPAPSGAANSCQSVTIDLNENGDLRYVFDFASAVWNQPPSFVGSVTIQYQNSTAPTAIFTPNDNETIPSEIQDGMYVWDINNQQNPSYISAIDQSNKTLTIQSCLTGITLGTTTTTLIVGCFYGTMYGQGCSPLPSLRSLRWNAYSAFLHYGANSDLPAPYISNQGYGFAYDDNGGYSSDITIDYPQNGNCEVGVYLGKLQNDGDLLSFLLSADNDQLVPALRRLQQMNTLMTGFQLSSAEAAYFALDSATPLSFPIDYSQLQSILTFKQLVQSFGDAQNNLLNILLNPNSASLDALTTTLSTLTGWDSNDLSLLISPDYLNPTSFTIDTLNTLNEYFTTATTLGISVPALWDLAQAAILETSSFSDTNFQAPANALWSGLQAQYKNSPTVLDTIQNSLNTALRDSLVAQACAAFNATAQSAQSGIYVHITERDLYDYFLIDVEVSGVVMTSPIREAISAVQLYIHRCLNNIEQNIALTSGSSLPTLWVWMQRYRTWQANMEVFLYPEDYIEPELRLDKTDLFTAAQHALKQTDLTNPDSVETVFLDYMTGLHEINAIQIISSAARDYTAYYDYQTEGVPEKENFKELCMIGKRSASNTHYYCRFMTFRYSDADGQQYVPYKWGEWEKIPVPMNTVSYIDQNQQQQYGIPQPIFAFDRWNIFWIEQQQSGSSPGGGSGSSGGGSGSSSDPAYTATINGTFLNFSKQWTPAEVIFTVDLGTTPISVTQPTTTTTTYNWMQPNVQFTFAGINTTQQLFFTLYTSSNNNEMYYGCYQPFSVPTSVMEDPTTHDVIILGYPIQFIDVQSFDGNNISIIGTNAGFSLGLSGPQIYLNQYSTPNVVQCIEIEEDNNNCYIGTAKGLYLAQYVAWQHYNQPILVNSSSSLSVTCLTIDSDNNLQIGTTSGLYSVKLPLAPDSTLTKTSAIDTVEVQCITANQNGDVYVGTSSGSYYRDSGGTWVVLTGNNNAIPLTANVTVLMYDHNNSTAYIGTTQGVYYGSGGNDNAWSQISGFIGSVTCMEQDTNGNIYIGTSSGLYYTSTTSTTPTLTLIPPPSGAASTNITSLVMGNTNIYAGTSSGVWYGTGNSGWTLLTGGSEGATIPSTVNVTALAYVNNNIFIGTSNGAVYGGNQRNGGQWQQMVWQIQQPIPEASPTLPASKVYGTNPPVVTIWNESDWYIVNDGKTQYLNIAYPSAPPNSSTPTTPTQMNVYRLNSTALDAIASVLNSPGGLDTLLSPQSQLQQSESPLSNLSPNSQYIPQSNYPLSVIDFTSKSAMQMYVWEIFFHLPFLIAKELNLQQQFQEAKAWYEYIFNPLVTGSTDTTSNQYWMFQGLVTDGTNPNQTLATELTEGEYVELYNDLDDHLQRYTSDTDPFDPQAIAELRPIGFQKTIVMHYIDNLLDWGDMLYRQNTRTSINEAEMLYMLAYTLLGTQPQNLGPYPLAAPAPYQQGEQVVLGTWQQGTGFSTKVTQVNCFYAFGGTLFAGTNAGLYTSADNGQTWSNPYPSDDPVSSADCNSMCADDSGTLCLGTTSAIYTSSDGGTSWTQALLSGSSDFAYETYCIENYKGTLFAGTNGNGLYTSVDGVSWEQNPNGTTETDGSAITDLCAGGDVLFMTVWSKSFAAYRSLDGGTTWGTFVTTPAMNNAPYIHCIFSNNRKIFIGTDANGLWTSAEDGTGASQNTNGLTTSMNVWTVFAYGDTLFLGTSGDGLYTSTDGGNSWQQNTTGVPTNANVYSIYEANGMLLVGTDSGVYYQQIALTIVPYQWNSVNSVPGQVNFVYAFGDTLFAGTNAGLYTSTDNGQTWKVCTNPNITSASCTSMCADDMGMLYLLIDTGTSASCALYTSSDNGVSWQPLTISNSTLSGAVPNCIVSYNDILFLGTTVGTIGSSAINPKGLFYSNDYGTTWIQQTDITSTLAVYFVYLYGDMLLAGTSNGMWQSTDGGTTWIQQPVQNGIPAGTNVTYICLQGIALFVGTGQNKVYTSYDGQNWSPITSNALPSSGQYQAIFAYGNTLFLGTSGDGLYTSTDGGNSWQQNTNGVPADSIVVVYCIYEAGGMIFVGTNSGLYVALPAFGIPRNEQFLSYWDEVQSRISNIRNGLTIDGQPDALPLFSPPINPMALVAAVGSGQSVAEAIVSMNNTVPYYRFSVMIEKAKEITAMVIQLGQALLSALEAQDAQKLAKLYQTNEQSILQILQAGKQDAITNAQSNLASLRAGLQSAQYRQTYYQGLLNAGNSAGEQSQIGLASSAIAAQNRVEDIHIASIAAYFIPTIFGLSDGGFHPGDAISQGAAVAESIGSLYNQQSQLAGTNAGFARRTQDWQFQQQLATDDITQLNFQIKAAQAQVDAAQQDLTVWQTNTAQEQKVADFYQTKFTNDDLYSWYIGQLSGLYFQAYQMAHDIAIQAENAWIYEHIGLQSSNTRGTFISPSYWNSLYDGLLVGESLQLDLLRMEKAYLDQHVRRFEITKTISLASHDPVALLSLITTGTCPFSLLENDFAWDFPGHYCRKIKSIAVSLPMIVGPYQNIHATLTQTSNTLITTDDATGQQAVQYLLGAAGGSQTSAIQKDLRPNQQIALSQGINDTGLFELNFSDPRYLPFEGTGAVSTWQLDMPREDNLNVDFLSITDVIIEMRYTALAAGSEYTKTVKDSRIWIAEIYCAQQSGWKAFIANPSTALQFSVEFQGQVETMANITPSPTIVLMSTDRTILNTNGLTITLKIDSQTLTFENFSQNSSVSSTMLTKLGKGPHTLTLSVTAGTLPSNLSDIVLIF